MASGLAASDVLSLSQFVSQNTAAGWTFSAPPGTAIVAAELDRDLFKRGDDRWALFVMDQSGAAIPGQNCAIDIGTTFQCEVAGVLSLATLDAAALSVGAICAGSACATGVTTHNVRADLDHAVVTISDPTPPAPPTAGGSLTEAGWHSGRVPLTTASSDAVGISRLQAIGADGTVLATATQPCDYTFPTPCPSAATAALQINTTSLNDGPSTVTLVATDAAQNTSTTTIHPMIANRLPPAPTLTGAPTGPTPKPSATITAQVPSGGVPIQALDWMLCTTTSCGPQTAVPVHDATASFTAAAPADGSYAIKAFSVDAAGHASAFATVPFVVDRSAPAPLAAGSGASLTLPAAVGHDGVRLLMSLRRRPHGRIELTIRSSPKRAGAIYVGLTFSGHTRANHTLHLRHSRVVVVAHVPAGSSRLTIALKGLGAAFTRRVRLGPTA